MQIKTTTQLILGSLLLLAVARAHADPSSAVAPPSPKATDGHSKAMADKSPGLDAASYPQWRNDGSGSAADAGVQVIDDITQTKMVWKSEEQLPDPWNKTKSGGCGGPSVANGAVYISYYQRSGEFIDKAVVEILQQKYPKANYDPQDFRVFADDVLVCMDAATGKTRWRKVMAGKGFNTFLLQAVYMSNPAVVGNRVVYLGSAGRVYCLDTKSGDLLWEGHIGPGHEMAWKEVTDWANSADPFSEEYRKKVSPTRGSNPSNFRFGDSGRRFTVNQPVATDSLVIMGDGIGGLTCLSLETGKQVWHRPGVLGRSNWASPTLWKHGDRYFVLHNITRGMQCTDAATGEMVWQQAGVSGGQLYSPVVSGDIMVGTRPSPTVKKAGELTGWRISPEGATLLWHTDANQYTIGGNHMLYWSPVIHRGHCYLLTETGYKQAYYLCIDMKDGAIKGSVSRPGGDAQAPLVAGDGLVFEDWNIFKADPKDFRALCVVNSAPEGMKVPALDENGHIKMPDGSTVDFPVLRHQNHYRSHCNVYAGGFYYYRGHDRLYCMDMRKGDIRN